MSSVAALPLPRASYEYVEGWGMAVGAHGRVLRPRDVDEVRAAFALARRLRATLALRGAGCSYGDASVPEEGLVLDLSAMDRVLAFDARDGLAVLEPGVTVEKLWRAVLPQGFWPPVVPGTMFATVGGAAAMNIHGKNNYAVGTFGDWIRELDLVLPSGELRNCSREREADLFHAAIGGFGMLGVMTRLVLQCKRVHSGDLLVWARSARNLREAMECISSRTGDSDYLVAWIDAFARGESLGRGLVHGARHLAEGEDASPGSTLSTAHQDLPRSILGVPKSEAWRILRLLNNDRGMRLMNAVKQAAGRLETVRGPRRQSHAAFAFLLDYVPNWKWAYGRRGRRGLIQHQVFVPQSTARETLEWVLRRSQEAGHVPYLGVLKRHRPDPFWLTHAVDGWSLALDYKVTPERRPGLWRLCAEITERVIGAGGRFYFAKDLVLGPADARRMFPGEKLEAFTRLKRGIDPEALLQTRLSRRVFGAQWPPPSSPA